MVCRRKQHSCDRRHITRCCRSRPGGRIFQPGKERRRGHPLRATMRPLVVVVYLPLVENHAGIGQAQEQHSVEQLIAKPTVEALDVAVLPRARILDGERADARPRQSRLDLIGNELRSVVT